MIIALSLPFAAFSMPEEWPVKIKAPLLSLLLLSGKVKGEYCHHIKYTGPEFRGLFYLKL